MAFKCARFKIDSWSGAGFANMQAWADDYLTKLKNAFIEASNGQWALYSDIENIVGSDNVNYPKRTLQLYNSTTNKYLRFWCFGNTRSVFLYSTPTASSNDNVNMCLLNLFSTYYSGSGYDDYCMGSEETVVFFGIRSQNSIDKDLGLDLHLDVPLFRAACSTQGISRTASGSSARVSASYNYDEGYESKTYSIITDGDAFWIARLRGDLLNATIYAPDLYICANEGDDHTEGVIGVNSTSNNFYLGINSSNGEDAYGPDKYLTFMFKNKDGIQNFSNYYVHAFAGKYLINTVSTSSVMATSAVTVYLKPYNQSGSSGDAIINGVCLKGWVNPDYVRSVNVDHLTYAQRGTTFGNGRWICVDAGVLLPWDISNTSSPFDPYVA